MQCAAYHITNTRRMSCDQEGGEIPWPRSGNATAEQQGDNRGRRAGRLFRYRIPQIYSEAVAVPLRESHWHNVQRSDIVHRSEPTYRTNLSIPGKIPTAHQLRPPRKWTSDQRWVSAASVGTTDREDDRDACHFRNRGNTSSTFTQIPCPNSWLKSEKSPQ